MEVVTAAGLKPLTLHKTSSKSSSSDGRVEAKRLRLTPLTLPRSSSDSQKSKWTNILSKSLGGGLAFISAVLATTNLAKALTYEEALQQSVDASSSFGDSAGIDASGIANFVSDNPLVIGGGVTVVAVPFVLSQILKKEPKKYGVESAKSAYAKLSEDPDAQLLDIRDVKEAKVVGSPELKSLKKKAVSIGYRGDDKPGFLKKLSLRFKDPENTTLYILDKFDGNSELVAELVSINGFKSAYAIKDGAEGARGWLNSGLPWREPKKTLNIDIEDLKDAISGVLGDGSDGLPVTLGLAAATGLGVFAFTEVETLLQLVGSAALVQFATKKLLFAEDRKVTLQQVGEFLNTKVAPKELVDELKMIGKALLPASENVRASLPAPAEAVIDNTISASTESVNSAPETKADTKVDAAAEPSQAINSVPKAGDNDASVPVTPRPLSPYPYYPDFKPPSSPCPSQP